MAITRATIANQLVPGYNMFWGLAEKQHQTEYTQFMDVSTENNRAFIEDASVAGFQIAEDWEEGQTIALDESKEGWVERYDFKQIGLGFKVGQLAIEDNLYMDIPKKYVPELHKAIMNKIEQDAADVLNNATSGSHLYGDGKPLLSTTQKYIKGGEWSNTLDTPADLSEAAIEALVTQIELAKDMSGAPMQLLAKQLIIPKNLRWAAERLLMSGGRVGTADNDINTIKDIFTSNYTAVTRLTDPDQWFIRTDASDGLKFINRISPSAKITHHNPLDGTHTYAGRARYGVGCTRKHGIYGSEGAA